MGQLCAEQQALRVPQQSCNHDAISEDFYSQQMEGLHSTVNSTQACLEHKMWSFKEKFVLNNIFHVKLCSGLFISNTYVKDITMVFRN